MASRRWRSRYAEAAAAQWLRNRILELPQPVQHVLILARQPLERLLVVLEAVLEDDADDAALLLDEQIAEAVD